MSHPNLTGRRRALLALLAGSAVVAGLVPSGAASASVSSAAKKGTCPSNWKLTKPCIPAGQPDVNKDGKVVIAILSPGDTNDNGYYESFIITARQFAKRNKWKLVITDKIPLANAAVSARNACRQRPDMVAIAASELRDAIPVSAEPVCKGTVWYVAGGQGVTQTNYFFQTSDVVEEGQYATGVAAGEIMKAKGVTKAGFITGPELDFSVTAYKSFKAGILSVVPGAQVVATYTGSFDDAGLGNEAAKAQISQGVGIIYPYLGGATDAVASTAKQSNVQSITPGTDRCADTDGRFAISSIFSPGDYFAAALRDFEKKKVKLGVTRTFRLGKDPVPSVKVCANVANASTVQAAVDKVVKEIASGQIDPKAEVAKVS